MIEKLDPTFQDLFYPQELRCPLENRIVRAIEEHWPVYYPTRKECRGPTWSVTIHEDELLYKPHPQSKRKLDQWKKRITGTIAEGRAYRADLSWRRFVSICETIPRLKPFLNDFKPLADFLMREESMWPTYGGPVEEKEYFEGKTKALFGPDSPYLFSASERSRFINSKKPTSEKIQIIRLICELFEWPIMTLAILQRCAGKLAHSRFWLPIENHINAIIKNPSPITFRKTWLEHAMQVSGTIKKDGTSNPRKWARMLVFEKNPDLNVINSKAVEVNSWLKGKKQPSMETIRRSGRVIFTSHELNPKQFSVQNDLWLFSWMVTLWLEKHFTEVAWEMKGDRSKMQTYYRRFFRYMKSFRTA
ncbi:MAG: hypothetical protein JWM68_3668 [Verrucomicrobiales bacterium]|nr:hypothetical protein [Verrucomicrobiales bacterium]